jgi:phosphoribosylamine--glycine ligase
MRILVVGSGGREHALLARLARSPRRPQLFVAPGNAGMAQLATPVAIPATDLKRLVDFAETAKVDLTVCGPEVPLCMGLADAFSLAGLPFIGPSRLASALEGSKAYAKAVMSAFGIPTAAYAVFRELAPAVEYLDSAGAPVVIKADGLCAGKGVFLPAGHDEAVRVLESLLVDGALGDAGRCVVIEERLSGTEASLLAFTDGRVARPMATAMDYKRLGDGDAGPNTGGMGAVSPNPVLGEADAGRVMDRVVEPLLAGLRARGIAYRGVLYAGLMMTGTGPMVLEFNVRFGDPEAQVILPRLRTDLVEVLEAIADERLADLELAWDPRPAVCVVLASAGYPGPCRTGVPIQGVPEAEAADVLVCHAGTDRCGGALVTSGGRVLSLVAQGETLAEARRRVYDGVSLVSFEGMQYRRDIGGTGTVRAA